MSIAPWWQQARTAFLDLLFPPTCQGCGRFGQWFCDGCAASVRYIEAPACSRCGQSLAAGLSCAACARTPLPAALTGLRAAAHYDGALRKAIHELKYERVSAVAEPLGKLLGEYLARHPLPCDVIVPVPLHPERRADRGFNQAEMLALVVGRQSKLPVNTTVLVRRLNTTPQVGLNQSERHRNVRAAFICARRVDGMRVLVVDDVCTTGATLSECAEALQAGGAASVWGLTLAR